MVCIDGNTRSYKCNYVLGLDQVCDLSIRRYRGQVKKIKTLAIKETAFVK